MDELDVNMNLLSCRNANKMDETVKPTRSPLLDINNMSNDIEIALCCGFRMNKLRQILNKVNVELPEGISALKILNYSSLLLFGDIIYLIILQRYYLDTKINPVFVIILIKQ